MNKQTCKLCGKHSGFFLIAWKKKGGKKSINVCESCWRKVLANCNLISKDKPKIGEPAY